MAETERRQFETDPDKIVWTKAYKDAHYRAFLGTGLLAFGAHEFKDAMIIRQLEQLELAYTRKQEGAISKDDFSQLIQPFIWAKLTDDIKIITFFENYMKAHLLFKGAIIHKFKFKDRDKQKAFEKEQNKAPLGFEVIDGNDVKDENFKGSTIEMRLMLGKGYQRVIKLPQDVLTIVKRINKERNRLHFYNATSFTLSKKVIKEFRTLNDFADGWIDKLKKAQQGG